MTTPQKTTQKTTQKTMQAMKENSGITIAELADICELSVDGIKYNLKVLTADGIIKRVGGRKNGHWEVTESRLYELYLIS
jgi:ATP-dependent DNA helicase RecG